MNANKYVNKQDDKQDGIVSWDSSVYRADILPFFFYHLKVGLKIEVPTWVPFIVSFVFFGNSLLGVSSRIVSSSWDPMREGSVLGWNEAKKN